MVAKCSSLWRDNFAGGEITGTPHVPACDRTPRCPLLSAPFHLLTRCEQVGRDLLRWLEAEEGECKALTNSIIVDGKDIGAAKTEDEQHFDGPAADAAHLCEVFDDVLIGHLFDGGECGYGVVECLGREVAKGEHFVLRESGRAELLIGAIEQMLRGRVVSETADGFETCKHASVNGGCRLAMKLLIDDGLGQRLEGRLL